MTAAPRTKPNNCWDAGVNLLIAAGNEYTQRPYNQYGNNLVQADTPDNAAVASPPPAIPPCRWPA